MSTQQSTRLATALAALGCIALAIGLRDVLALEPLTEAVRRAGPTMWAAWFLLVALGLVIALVTHTPAVAWLSFGSLAWIALLGRATEAALFLFGAAAIVSLSGITSGRSARLAALSLIVGLSVQIVFMDVAQHLLLDRGDVRTSSSGAAIVGRWVLACSVIALALLHSRRRAQPQSGS